jgi:hypothetical protein
MRGLPEIKLSNPSVSDLYNDIEHRRVLIGTMVGGLYPSILNDEIETLKDMIREQKYHDHEHEFYTEADFTQEEIERRNVLAVAVIGDSRKICRRCGYESCEN